MSSASVQVALALFTLLLTFAFGLFMGIEKPRMNISKTLKAGHLVLLLRMF